jgi:pimeloyl-ACP methyl ester carboxylesterase
MGGDRGPQPASPISSRTTSPPYVIVHGAFQGAGVWRDVRRALEDAGRSVQTIDLPGRPGNPLPVEQVTLDRHRDCVLSAIARAREPVVLVGHSFGGMVISAAANSAPEKIATLVYVAAYLPQSGESARVLAREDTHSRWNEQNFVISADYATVTALRGDCVMLFGEDLSPEQQRLLPERLVPEPLRPVRTPVVLAAERFGPIDKVYVKTLRDNTISPRMQDTMLARVPVRKVVEIDSSHSPYLSRPAELAGILLAATAR